ncbi:hypothetical protein F383_29893 [Gossypium arboreum]|uniref:Uncharacterized protein n=1 Tax=Gossypium arboreum TaxID=29729 RepID=A0A0B0PJM8_GOSAR|nr:hypothetical protein F383_19806 [Gossypium arboreum]KHG17886.1 hypothetical protein F383_23833 [Gossypium arboreum]KHG23576.1 hypothetical protein F383_30250 [Gossypium arboreum]KHG23790.1 hypothetical protein F383_29893 [Gossypium arboreum]
MNGSRKGTSHQNLSKMRM